MLLAIDAGNTNIVFALYSGSKQVDKCRMETTGKIPESVNEIVQQYPDIDGVIISSVVPKINEALQKSCSYLIKVDPVFVTHENIPIEVKTDKPKEVGADRLVNSVTVIADYKKPAIIVDFGTATTFDVVDAQGCYAGGVIAPGINLSLEALHQAAAKLPSIKVEKPPSVIGKNTVDAMQSGIYWGYIGLIEGTIKRISEEMAMEKGERPFIIATGGLAPLFDQGTDMIDAIDDDLTMKGLVHVQMHLSEQQKRKSA
jgi:type III pantothenate kinase